MTSYYCTTSQPQSQQSQLLSTQEAWVIKCEATGVPGNEGVCCGGWGRPLEARDRLSASQGRPSASCMQIEDGWGRIGTLSEVHEGVEIEQD